MEYRLIGFLLMAIGAMAVRAGGWEQAWPGNWVVGLSTGYGNRYGDSLTTLTNVNALQFPAAAYTRNISDRGWVWGGLAGYQWIWHKYLVGGELNLERHDIDKRHALAFSGPGNTIGWSGNVRYENKTLLGLSGRAGYAIRSYFMLYARLGFTLARDNLNVSFFSVTGNPNSIALQETHWIHRFLTGIGAEIPLVPRCHTTLRLEYNYYSKGRTLEAQGTITNGVFPAFVSSLQPAMKVGKIALVWNLF